MEEVILNSETITMAHGSGGLASQNLLRELILPNFSNPALDELNDGAILNVKSKIAVSTDSFIIRPIFFPGGNIGKLSICGTVNDLAVSGAIPKYLTASVILEEGFPIDDLKMIVESMSKVAREVGIQIVTGDTKVVERGSADGIFINTTGIGEIIDGVNLSPRNVQAGMKILVSGFLGDHSAAILSSRHGLETNLESDCAPLSKLTQEMLSTEKNIAAMRDITRGGLAEVLNEIATESNVGILIDEEKIPIRDEVRGVCEILGFDPLNLANEGKLIAFVPSESAEKILDTMRKNPFGKNACEIGEVVTNSRGRVGMKTSIGSIRVVDFPPGELVPRIC